MPYAHQILNNKGKEYTHVLYSDHICFLQLKLVISLEVIMMLIHL